MISAEFTAAVVVANRAVERFIFADVEFWLQPVERRKACLGIEIEREHAVAAQSEILGEMGGGRGLAAAALEIDDGDHLEVFVAGAVRQVIAVALGDLREIATQLVEILDRVGAASPLPYFHRGAFALDREAAQIGVINAD